MVLPAVAAVVLRPEGLRIHLRPNSRTQLMRVLIDRATWQVGQGTETALESSPGGRLRGSELGSGGLRLRLAHRRRSKVGELERIGGVEGFVLIISFKAFEMGIREDESGREVDDEKGEEGENTEEVRQRRERPPRPGHGGG